jgi:hypothetical protein
VFDTSLYIYICVKHFGMANIKKKCYLRCCCSERYAVPRLTPLICITATYVQFTRHLQFRVQKLHSLYERGAGGKGDLCDFCNYHVGRVVRGSSSRECKVIFTELMFYVSIFIPQLFCLLSSFRVTVKLFPFCSIHFCRFALQVMDVN